MKKKNQVQEEIQFTASVAPEQSMDKVGFGDVVESLASALGIKKCPKCEERRQKLNRIFPFTKVQDVAPLTERELMILDDMDKSRMLKKEYMNDLFFAYNSRFVKLRSSYIEVCSCPGVIAKMKESLDLLRTEE